MKDFEGILKLANITALIVTITLVLVSTQKAIEKFDEALYELRTENKDYRKTISDLERRVQLLESFFEFENKLQRRKGKD